MADYTVDQIIAVKASGYVGDVRIPIFTDLADQQLTPCLTGNNRTYALALQVLHWLAMADRALADGGSTGGGGGVTSGPITRRKESELEISYAVTKGATAGTDMEQELKQTPYGVELYAFLRKFMVFAYTRRVGPCGSDTIS